MVFAKTCLLVPCWLALVACSEAGFDGANKSGGRKAKDESAKSSDATEKSSATGGDKKAPGSSPGPSPASLPSDVDEAGGTQPSTPGPSAPANVPADNALASVDSGCANSGDDAVVYPAYNPLPSTVPSSCNVGLVVNNLHTAFDLRAVKPSGSGQLTLDVEIATYLVPDRLTLTATTSSGAQVILNTCRLRTANSGGGDVQGRPPEQWVRWFQPVLPAGTVSLRVDGSAVQSASYLLIRGLCDFDLSGLNAFGQKNPDGSGKPHQIQQSSW